MYSSPVTNALWEARSKMYGDASGDAPPQSELVARTPAQSRTSILYNFSSDYKLREQYRNPWNGIRMGKLLEDLDALAGTIAFKHCCNEDGTTRPLLLVTASVDKMVLKKPILVDTDLNIGGAVIWVGKSSMEIQLEVTQSLQGSSYPSESIALTANFTFVARDSKSGKSAPVNHILPETEKEKLLWEEADKRNKMRKKKRAEHKTDTENQDTDRLNALLAEGRVFYDMPALADRYSILRRDTCLQNSFICQPLQRNIHGRIFGGFLMRRAFEIAFSTMYAFAGVAPHFLEIDHVIVTVSLGVLKASICQDSGMFNPPLPRFKTEAISRLGFGVVNKLFLQLGSIHAHPKFHDFSKFPFLQMVFHRVDSELRNKKIPWWMRKTASLCPLYHDSSILLSWFAGEETRALEALSDEEIINGAFFTELHRQGLALPWPPTQSSAATKPPSSSTRPLLIRLLPRSCQQLQRPLSNDKPAEKLFLKLELRSLQIPLPTTQIYTEKIY